MEHRVDVPLCWQLQSIDYPIDPLTDAEGAYKLSLQFDKTVPHPQVVCTQEREVPWVVHWFLSPPSIHCFLHHFSSSVQLLQCSLEVNLKT